MFFKQVKEQDKSSDIDQQPSFATAKHCLKKEGGGVRNQREHHIISTKYEALNPTYDSEKNNPSGMLIILIKKYIKKHHCLLHISKV